MADRSIARRYARAFMEVAEDAGAVDDLGGELADVLDIMHADGGRLLSALSNPVFTVEERRGVLDAVLARVRVEPLTANLLRLLLDKGRFDVLPLLGEVYAEMADDRAGRVWVQVQTAEPLTDALEAEIVAAFSRLTGKQVFIDSSVNPELIGGLVARVGSTVYDASLRRRLEDIKQSLLSARTPGEA